MRRVPAPARVALAVLVAALTAALVATLVATPAAALDAFDADDGPRTLPDRLERHRRLSLEEERRGDLAAAANHAAHACRVAMNLTWTPWAEECDRAVALARRAARPDLEALVYAFAGSLAGMGDDWTRALESGERALALVDEDDHLPAVRQVLFVRAGRATETGDFATSEAILRRVLEASRAVHDRESESQALAWLGRAALFSGDAPRARDFARQALEVARADDNRAQEMVALWTLGLTELEAGRPAASVAPHQEAAAVARQIGLAGFPTIMELNLAEAAVAMGELDRGATLLARVQADIAAGLAAPDWLGFALEVEGRLWLQRGDAARARERFAAVSAAPAAAAYWLRLRALLGTARAWAQEGNSERAVEAYEIAVAAVEAERWGTPVSGERRASFLSRNALPARELAELLWRKDGAASAHRLFGLIEGLRSRALADAARLARGGPALPAAAERDAETTGEKRLAAIRAELSADDVLVEYLLGESRALAVVIERSGITAVELARDEAVEDLERRADHFAQRVEEGASAEATRASGRALAERILDPLWAVTSSHAPPRRLWVVADSRLHAVPFAALVDGEGRFLVERTAVAMLPAAGVLLDTRPAAAAPFDRGILAIASTLPWSRREARLAAGALPSSTLLLGDEATGAALAAAEPGRHRVFHFAGHATWDPTMPERSALWLGGSRAAASEPLEAAAVYGWSSAPPLVILSACESARQSTSHGEGVHGLARAFLFAGSRQVVATLWPVADRPAFERMRDLYGAFASGKRVSDALGETQRAAIAAGAAPRDWAAFITAGDPRWGLLEPAEVAAHRRQRGLAFAAGVLALAVLGWAIPRWVRRRPAR
jgi:CHAT domain-containing protein